MLWHFTQPYSGAAELIELKDEPQRVLIISISLFAKEAMYKMAAGSKLRDQSINLCIRHPLFVRRRIRNFKGLYSWLYDR